MDEFTKRAAEVLNIRPEILDARLKEDANKDLSTDFICDTVEQIMTNITTQLGVASKLLTGRPGPLPYYFTLCSELLNLPPRLDPRKDIHCIDKISLRIHDILNEHSFSSDRNRDILNLIRGELEKIIVNK